MNRFRLFASVVLGVSALLFVGIQLVPYRVGNPPVRQEPTWDSSTTRELARRACFDCHSNEVQVPWYGYVAPFAWIVRDHVDEGRAALNFSEMDRPQEEAHEAGEEVAEGEMPPSYYLTLHADARLTTEEKRLLVQGLERTLGGSGHEGPDDGEEADDDDDDDDA